MFQHGTRLATEKRIHRPPVHVPSAVVFGKDMANYGFVYVLLNEAMPGMFKLGCTERAPRERASELSRATSVPLPFTVLCYAELPDFQEAERWLHKSLERHRVSSSREFFYSDGLVYALSLIFYHPHRVSFSDCTEACSGGPFQYLEQESLDGFHCYEQLPNPFIVRKPEPAEVKALPVADAETVDG